MIPMIAAGALDFALCLATLARRRGATSRAPNRGRGASRAHRAAGSAGLSRVDQHAGVEHAGRIQLSLGRGQGGCESIRPLTVVPGPVVATDRVVVGDGAARNR